jgi:hypothetical protein
MGRTSMLENSATTTAANGAITMICHPFKAITMIMTSETMIPIMLQSILFLLLF